MTVVDVRRVNSSANQLAESDCRKLSFKSTEEDKRKCRKKLATKEISMDAGGEESQFY